MQEFYPYLDKKLDGRVRIPKSQYQKVREKYKELNSQRRTAKYFNVSRRCIQFILDPESYLRQLKTRRDAKVHLKYYERERHTQAIKKYRDKKRKLGLAYNPKKYEKGIL